MVDPRANPDASQPARRTAPLIFGGAMLVIIAVVAILVSMSGDDSDDGAAGAIVCEPVPDDGGSEDCPTEIVTEPADVLVSTSEGDFQVSLDTEASPATTSSFRHLVEDGFYDGLTFHRVVPGFVIQGGDPNGDGSGGPGYYVDEDVPQDTRYTPGVVAMAKTGTDPPGRSGSQFFVVSGPGGQQLPPEYAYVGKVDSGMEVVDAIDALGTPRGEEPSKPVTIESMTLVSPAE